MINNRQAGRRRGRGGPGGNGGGGGGNPRQGGTGRPDNGNRIDNRARGNAPQLHEKYRNMAREAQMQGDRVNTEYYLQFADHYFRVLSDQRGRDDQPRRVTQSDAFDDGFGFGSTASGNFEGDQEEYGDEGEPVRAAEQPQRDDARDGRRDGQRENAHRENGPRENGPREAQREHVQRDGGQRDEQREGQRDTRRDSRDDSQRDGQREGNQREGNQREGNQRDGFQRDAGRQRDGNRDNTLRDNTLRDNAPRDNGQREFTQRDAQRDGIQRDGGERPRNWDADRRPRADRDTNGGDRRPRMDRGDQPDRPRFAQTDLEARTDDVQPVMQPVPLEMPAVDVQPALVPAPIEVAAEAPRRRGRPRKEVAPVDAGDAAPAAIEADRLPPSLGISAAVSNDDDPDDAPKPRRRRVRAATPEAPAAE